MTLLNEEFAEEGLFGCIFICFVCLAGQAESSGVDPIE